MCRNVILKYLEQIVLPETNCLYNNVKRVFIISFTLLKISLQIKF